MSSNAILRRSSASSTVACARRHPHSQSTIMRGPLSLSLSSFSQFIFSHFIFRRARDQLTEEVS